MAIVERDVDRLWAAFEAGHWSWPTPDVPTRRARFDQWYAAVEPLPAQGGIRQRIATLQGYEPAYKSNVDRNGIRNHYAIMQQDVEGGWVHRADVLKALETP